jgi:hypothetical protein
MAGQLTVDTLRAGSGVLATQNGMTGIAKAWVQFNGQGTVAINGSFNVSSITDNGTGDYTVNFTTAMPNINYVPNINYSPIYGTYYTSGARLFSAGAAITEQAPTTSGFRFSTGFVTGNEQDPKYVCVAVFSS